MDKRTKQRIAEHANLAQRQVNTTNVSRPDQTLMECSDCGWSGWLNISKIS